MNKLSRIFASGMAFGAAFAQAAMAGNAYSPDPVIEDSGSDAGMLLLAAVLALLVVKAVVAKPKAGGGADASE